MLLSIAQRRVEVSDAGTRIVALDAEAVARGPGGGREDHLPLQRVTQQIGGQFRHRQRHALHVGSSRSRKRLGKRPCGAAGHLDIGLSPHGETLRCVHLSAARSAR